MKNLLKKYAQLNSITVADICGTSRKNGMSTHRHILAYCLRINFPTLKLWQIAETIMKKTPSTHYGIKVIKEQLKPIVRKNKILPQTSDVKILKRKISIFSDVCKRHKRSDLIIPQKEQ